MKVNRMFAVSFEPRCTSCRPPHDGSTTTSTCSFPRISEGFRFLYILTFSCFQIRSLKKEDIDMAAPGLASFISSLKIELSLVFGYRT